MKLSLHWFPTSYDHWWVSLSIVLIMIDEQVLYKTKSCHLSAKLLVFWWGANRTCQNFEDNFKYLQQGILRDTEKKSSLKGIRYKSATSELSRIKFYLFYLPTSHIWQIYSWKKKNKSLSMLLAEQKIRGRKDLSGHPVHLPDNRTLFSESVFFSSALTSFRRLKWWMVFLSLTLGNSSRA